jgi:hypothetical protein
VCQLIQNHTCTDLYLSTLGTQNHQVHYFAVEVHALGDECWIGITYDKPAVTHTTGAAGTARLPSYALSPHSFPAGHTWGLYGGKRSSPVYQAGDVVGVLVSGLQVQTVQTVR